MYNYLGLTVESELELDFAEQVTASSVHVSISLHNIPEHPKEGVDVHSAYCAVGNQYVWLFIPDMFRMEILNGKEIRIQLLNQAQGKELVLRYLENFAFAMLYQQKGELVTHSTAVEWLGEHWIFCADTGVGKSSLAAYLMQKHDAKLIGDEITIFESSARSIFSTGFVDLQVVVASLLNIPNEQVVPYSSDMSRCRWNVPKAKQAIQHEDKVPRNIVLLESSNESELKFSRLHGADSLNALMHSVYKPYNQQHIKKQTFFTLSKLAAESNIYRLSLPREAKLDTVARIFMEFSERRATL
ncbi:MULTISPECIES: hypothetical protein [Gammaproteobacteria]|uniref:hypothetical protein n=1 Tax=Gammaproteobacteria TaxID=1236 RepID=UPI000DCFF946|nr:MULTISPECIES: hypothetical protein [Gammaproteobacteria]RTE86087.1 hypothetical protein DQX04_05815 [Aliidiomarina sp. B3213]TCZ91441.1 hypothetical protein EYQ95_05825 [Lysobacter sp. N42]